MKMKVELLFLLVTLCCGIFGAVNSTDTNIKPRYLWNEDVMDVTDFSVYYDMKTNKISLCSMLRHLNSPKLDVNTTLSIWHLDELMRYQNSLKLGVDNMLNIWYLNGLLRYLNSPKLDVYTIKNIMPRPWYRPGWGLRLPFYGGPCECDGIQCTCCTGIRIQAFNFDRRTCAVITYDPEDSTFDVEAKLSNVTVMKDTYSTRNPPPFCIPIPIPYLPPGLVDTCIRIFDITIVDQKLHACLDMDTRIDKAPIVILHFDCMDMGLSGISLSKPSGSDSESNSDSTQTQLNSDIYDAVTETMEFTTEQTNSIRYI